MDSFQFNRRYFNTHPDLRHKPFKVGIGSEIISTDLYNLQKNISAIDQEISPKLIERQKLLKIAAEFFLLNDN